MLFADIVTNIVVVMTLHIGMYFTSLLCIRGNKENTEYTKNMTLTRRQKIWVGLAFYKENRFEMEGVINLIINNLVTVVFLVTSFFVNIIPKNVFIWHIVPHFIVIYGGLIYRFKKDDFKDKHDHYE